MSVVFTPGQVIMHRNVRRGRIGWVRPARVVADDDRGLLLWIDRHTPVVNEVSGDGRGMRTMPFAEYVTLGNSLKHGTWNGPGVLKLHRPGDPAHSVWWFHDDAGDFKEWYVNLERPAIRWSDPGGASGVDVTDEDLDIVVAPDRSWKWKDEEEFLERLALPEHYWVEDEAAVREEGLRVIKEIEAGTFPFDGTWTDFRPPPEWEVPRLEPGWDRPPLR
ncbi:DUF402 domain-containing protein [Dactylosporangium matsuzakiense]|uniref:DUF402 domain-containing protein n=2 Tax=Dactylosporangium TaxID=35753 RepID=A0A9W6KI97_9ACTN|nr:hypothetical protein GCM10017581_037750 [Dactylosporangium matsuzakiense]